VNLVVYTGTVQKQEMMKMKKGKLVLEKGRLLQPYPCTVCRLKTTDGYMPKTNEYGFFVICESCFKKGYRADKFGKIMLKKQNGRVEWMQEGKKLRNRREDEFIKESSKKCIFFWHKKRKSVRWIANRCEIPPSMVKRILGYKKQNSLS
jgi:hypothetical protein